MKTKSEELFEKFLEANSVPFEKIKEDSTPRPDYLVSINDLKLVFEVKELAEDENFGAVGRRSIPSAYQVPYSHGGQPCPAPD